MKTIRTIAVALSAGALLPAPAQLLPREVDSAAAGREAIALTIYNDDLALIKDKRRVELPGGLARLSLREVSAQLRPETALLRASGGDALRLIEQNFDFDLLTPQKLLDKHVGREVSVLRTLPTTGEERRERATVLAAGPDGTVLRFADRIETGVPGRIAFDQMPANLRERPTLSVLLESSAGPQAIELSYLSGGLSWKADYVASLSADGKALDLSGWVTLDNRSGASYENASLQLVAGALNRVQAKSVHQDRMAPVAAMLARAEPVEEALFDYHLYRFERPTTIADQQVKQLALLTASAVPVRREYLLSGAEHPYLERQGPISQKLKPAVFLEFDNAGGQLGKPLPAGVVRVYARDRQGAEQFVGEDRIGHSARNETVRLRLGEAFDILAERKQTSWRKLGDSASESAYRIELRNGKDEPVTVRVLETLPGDWEIVQESQRSRKESARAVSWSVDVPAGGSAVLDYLVRVRW